LGPDSRPSVLHLIHSLEGGGTERTLVTLLDRLDTSQLRHRVVTLRSAGSPAAMLPDHVACLALHVRARSRTIGWRIAREARRTRAACIHARNTGAWHDAITAAWACPGLRPILGFHGFDNGTDFTRRQRWLARLGWCAGGRFASVSVAGRAQLVRQCGIPSALIEVLPNGVDTSRFLPSTTALRREMRHDLGIAQDSFVVGTVGSITPIKRLDLLVDAASTSVNAVPDLTLVIVGDGPSKEAVRLQVQNRGLANHVCLPSGRDDIWRMLGAMDVFVNCSDTEGMSNALLEALACGLTSIVTDVGDNSRLVRDGIEGIVIPPSSTDDLVRAIVSLAHDAGRRRAMACAARDRAASYSLPMMVERYDRFYRDLVFGAAGPPRYLARGKPASLLLTAATGRTSLGRPVPAEEKPRSTHRVR